VIRKARALWRGSGRDGNGALSTDSGVLANTPYSFRTRFESEKGTNPEELLAAAHAGCFTMALAFRLQRAGYTLQSSIRKQSSPSNRTRRASASVTPP
jgi:lipoyl-dependent peroxiredoxin